jgi:TRAP transporter TAXI family solute receptor
MKTIVDKKILGVLVILILLFSFFVSATSFAAPAINRSEHLITVLTGPTSGIYFPIGGSFSTFLGRLGYRTSATATGATVENINSLLTGQGELAIAMADSVIQAVESFGAYEGKPPAKELRAMMGLWPNYCQIVTTEDTGIKTFEDMKGKRVGIGAPNSGVELNARMMFEAHGMKYDNCRVDYLSYGEAIAQMRNGLCDVAFVTSGLGNATIMELGVSKKIAFVPVEGEPMRKLLERYPFYIESTIPAATYGTDKDVTTAAVMNIMLVDVNLPDEVVYDLLENIFSPAGLEAIHASHAVAKEHINLGNALRGIERTSVPLHNGAIKFYKDKGLLP